jgi:PAS domain S-box-containing protein
MLERRPRDVMPRLHTPAGLALPRAATLAIVRSTPLERYVAAVVIATGAIALRFVFDSVWGVRLPFITLFPAVMLSAWLGGLGPGLLTTAAGAIAAMYLWLQPRSTFQIADSSDLLGLAIFVAVGVAISVLHETWRRGALAVLESEERLKVTLAGIGDAVIGTDADGRVTTFNAVAEALTGWTAREATGRPLNDVCVVRRESQSSPEGVLVARDGRERHVHVTVAPIRSAGEKVIGTLVVFRDISERRRVELLRDEEQRATRMLAAIVESSDDAIVAKNLNSEILSWNVGAERMFGYSAEEAVGRSIRLIIPEDRMSEEDEVLRRLRLGQRVDHFETVRRRKDGRLILVSLTISPIHDQDGVVVGASKIARDITALREIEAERVRLLREHAVVTEQLNQVGAAVASDLDRDSIVQAVTDAATELTTAEIGAFVYTVPIESGESYVAWTISGMSRDEFAKIQTPRGITAFDPAFHGTEIIKSDDITRDRRYSNTGSVPFEDIPTGHSGIRSYLAIPVLGRTGQLLGGLFFGHSSPGRFTAQHERLAVGVASWASVSLENSALYREAREASRLKDHFLATLSHELRTPLNAILGYARMLRSGMVPHEKQPRAIQVIERNATSLTQIVEDVLDVSRIVSGKLRLNMQVVELPDVLRAAVDAILPAAEAKGIHVEARLDPEAAPVSGDPERLQQVFWNLLSNAVKFTGAGGRISVQLARVDNRAEISVCDTGIGIGPEFLPHIFERFRQADAGFTRERGGLGLGLSITRQLLEMHEGTIEASSEGLGHGSTFRLSLPLAVVSTEKNVWPSASAVEERTEAPLPDLSTCVVLSVDDETDARRLVAEILENAGARVVSAGSAMEALEILEREEPPDVILADIGMPHIDGFQFIDRVRHHRDARVRDVPAAALTAFARSEDRIIARRVGFQRHLAKPLDPVELLTTVAALCRASAKID